MKKIIRTLFSAFLVLTIVCSGCGIVEEPSVSSQPIEEPVKEIEKTPEDTVIKFSDGFKDFDFATMTSCCTGISKSDMDPNEIFVASMNTTDRDQFGDAAKVLLDYMGAKAKSVTYEIQNVEIGTETATVTVHYSFADATPVMQDGMTNWIAQALALSMVGNPTTEELMTKLPECLKNSTQTVEADKAETVLKYSCVKKDGEWLISGITGKDDFVDLVTCKLNNMNDALKNSLSDNLKQGNSGSSSLSSQKEPAKKLTIEKVDSDGTLFKNYSGSVNVSYWMKYKNTSDCDIKLTDTYVDYYDNDGKLIGSDQFVQCIPEVLRPGEEGYIYSYHHNLGSAYKNNGCKPEVNYVIKQSSSTYTIQCIDGFYKESLLGLEVTVKAKNSSSNKISFAQPGAVFYGKNGEVLGFCYTLESFEAGETKTFTMSGSLLTDGIDASKVTDVKIYMQGDSKLY